LSGWYNNSLNWGLDNSSGGHWSLVGSGNWVLDDHVSSVRGLDVVYWNFGNFLFVDVGVTGEVGVHDGSVRNGICTSIWLSNNLARGNIRGSDWVDDLSNWLLNDLHWLLNNHWFDWRNVSGTNFLNLWCVVCISSWWNINVVRCSW